MIITLGCRGNTFYFFVFAILWLKNKNGSSIANSREIDTVFVSSSRTIFRIDISVNAVRCDRELRVKSKRYSEYTRSGDVTVRKSNDVPPKGVWKQINAMCQCIDEEGDAARRKQRRLRNGYQTRSSDCVRSV